MIIIMWSMKIKIIKCKCLVTRRKYPNVPYKKYDNPITFYDECGRDVKFKLKSEKGIYKNKWRNVCYYHKRQYVKWNEEHNVKYEINKI